MLRIDMMNKLELDEINLLPVDEKSRYYQRYFFELIKKNERQGLTSAEIQKITAVSSNTISKYLDALFYRRSVYRVKRGTSTIYFPNGKITHPLTDRDILVKDDFGKMRKYRIYRIENPEGQFIHVQEKESDENGFDNIVGGILFPIKAIPLIKNALEDIEHTNLKIEE